MNTSVYRLFPTAVMSFELDAPITDLELKAIKSLDYHNNTGNRRSDNDDVFGMYQLSRLSEFCKKCLNDYIDEVYKPESDIEAYVTQSWTNLTTGNEFHHTHSHANSFISGVLYVDGSKEDQILFRTPNPSKMIQIPPREFTDLNSESWWIPAKNNTVVVFPSWLVHEVPVLDRSEDRISLAFNSFLRGKIGSKQSLTELIL